MSNVRNALPLGKYAGFNATGGGWNDLSLLLNPGMGSGANAMSLERVRSQFSLHCVMAANLFLTGNLSRLDPAVLAIWGNDAAIAVNQDSLGLPHRQLPPDTVITVAEESSGPSDEGAIQVRGTSAATTELGTIIRASKNNADPRDVAVAECGGEPAQQAWQWTNESTVTHGGECLNVKACRTEIILDACTKNGCGGGSPGAPAANEVFTQPPPGGGPITVTLDNKKKCLTAIADARVSIAECTHGDASQQWTYDPDTRQIKSNVSQQCLTAAGTPPAANESSLIIGRPLVHGQWAVLFLNNDVKAVNMTCGHACLAAAGFTHPPVGTAIDDVWGGRIGFVSAGGFSVVVPPDGASRFVVLAPVARSTSGPL